MTGEEQEALRRQALQGLSAARNIQEDARHILQPQERRLAEEDPANLLDDMVVPEEEHLVTTDEARLLKLLHDRYPALAPIGIAEVLMSLWERAEEDAANAESIAEYQQALYNGELGDTEIDEYGDVTSEHAAQDALDANEVSAAGHRAATLEERAAEDFALLDPQEVEPSAEDREWLLAQTRQRQPLKLWIVRKPDAQRPDIFAMLVAASDEALARYTASEVEVLGVNWAHPGELTTRCIGSALPSQITKVLMVETTAA